MAGNTVTSAPTDVVTFRCNLCGAANAGLYRDVSQREKCTCTTCGSNRRYRSLMEALTRRLHSEPIALPDLPVDKSIAGIGLSDVYMYADVLHQKYDYANTWYHQEPRLDLLNVDPRMHEMVDFVVSSDVLEHIPPPIDRAFQSMYNLLKPGGVCVFSVPSVLHGPTVEHFPETHDFDIVQEDGQWILLNTTVDGRKQRFEDLVFHGGGGLTLEFRLFSQPALEAMIEDVGFVDIQRHATAVPEFGILFDQEFSVTYTMCRPGSNAR